MNKKRVFLSIAAVLAGILLSLQAALAQEPPPDQQAPAQDPPTRVARLSYSVGSVSFQPGGEGDWVTAVRNRPLTTGDNLWADKDSRAELQIGSTSIRIDAETSITLLEVDDDTTQIRLSQGSILFRIRHLDDNNHFEIDTPNSAFVVERNGEYRVDANSTGDESDVTIWRGRGEVTGGGASFDVVAGQRARFTGTDQLDHEIGQLPRNDDFDNFAFKRDENEDHDESSNYISPEVTGYDDLDEYGHWHYAADYGPVWTPAAVAPGWAPYRFGHWVWIDPWGWTWVEDEPWGFAPFHYGRWAFVGGAWCWAPGPIAVRPVYAPAFVAFVGGGSFAVGVAPVGWFPLAPREVYVPWYRTSPRYVNNVNITNTRVNVTQVTNVYNTTIINNNTTTVNRVTYVNQRVPNAVTAVSHDTFVNARPVHNNLVRVDENRVAEAPVVHNVPVQPVRQSVFGAGRPSNARPPAQIENRPVVATRTPTAPRPSFEQRQAPNVRTENPGRPEAAGRPEMQGRPEATPNNARPQGTPRPETETRPEGARPEANRPEETPRAGNVPRPPMGAGGHPYVRQAPPVQDNPQRQQNEEQKFRNWQQQRPAPRASEPPRASPHPSAAPRSHK